MLWQDEFEGFKSEKVPVSTLDNYLEVNQIKDCIDFIKIDVEGHELEVIYGAEKTIQNYRPVILCESENRHLKPHGKSTEEFIKFMQLHKYQVYTISKLTFELLEVDEISIPVEKTKTR